MSNPFTVEWKLKEKRKPRPTRVRQVCHRDWDGFAKLVTQGTDTFARYIVDSLYAGDVYILRGAFEPEFMESVRDRAWAYMQIKPSEFQKMVEGCTDFHRAIDPEAGKKYSFAVCKHSAFFYPWADPLGLFAPVYDRWRIIKRLMGLPNDAYEFNTPKDGVIDRIQVAQYPSRIGFLEPHSDPYLHQRLFFSGYMTKRGIDYEGGGFYLIGAGDKVVQCENDIEVGDIGIGYATIMHGVAPCNRDREPEWNRPSGRWFLSMYSNASDEVENRHTGYAVKLNIPEVMP